MRRVFWGILVFFFILFSLVPMFYELSRQNDLHPDRQFELVHNFYTDYNFYLSRIREGREGAVTVTEKYTSEPHQGSYIQIMYLAMGKVSAWFNVPWPNSGDTYHMARIVLSATLLFLISYAAKWAFEKFRFRWPASNASRSNAGWQILAFLLAVTASSWPIPVFSNNEWRFGGYMPWWSVMDSLQRITFIPHMLAGQALIVFLLVAFAQENVMKKAGNWVFLGFLAFLLGTVFPAGLGFVFAAWGVFIVLDFLYRLPSLRRERVPWILTRIVGPAIVGAISTPTLLYFSLVVKVYPWKRLIDYALLHPQPFNLREYILAVGPMLLFGVVGGLLVLVKRERRMFVFVAWVIAWMVLILAFQYIPQESPLRFTEMLPQVPLGILGAYLLSDLSRLSDLWKKIAITIAVGLIALGLGQMYSSWRWQKEFLDQKISATQPLVPTGSYVMYPLKDFLAAINFIQNTTSRSTVILSETTAGNYIPVYSGNTVYVGQANTVNTEQKELIVKDFFAGNMSPGQAMEFLKVNNLHYIFFGPQEEADGGLLNLPNTYPFLTEIYHAGLFRVYHW
ncbi:MAG: hypothetical protein NT149_01620 [Candidatus Gottesmanbacteria bacterium]|nr:hypothetical protein [Candidatus Gottesmanbacteria bacterium]